MARDAGYVSRDEGWGPWAFLGLALRVLLVIGLLHLAALAFVGGHFFFAPWFLMPFFFFWLFASPRGWGSRRRLMRQDAREYPGQQGDLPGTGGTGRREDLLELELASAQRQIRELETKLSWQERLLKTPPAPAPAAVPAAAPAPAAPAPPASAPPGEAPEPRG